ncbi:MAG: VWA domain-containing protein, partial [Pyrinomonadaceae bacterium]
MRHYKFFAFLLITVSCIFSVSAQDGDEISVDTSIVRLNIGAVTRSGQPVKSLTKENFSIYEDGVKQEITRFEPTSSPFSLVMILDMSGSTLGFRQTIQQSAYRFVDALAPEDRIAVIEFYDKVNLLNDFTENRRTVGHSISVANGRGKTQLYKALSLALQKLAGEGNRRKAIIVLTDGIDTGVRESDRSILAKAAESEVTTVIKPETNPELNNILTRADVQGITIYPLALPTGDPSKVADPSPIQFAWYSAARTRLDILAKR